MDIDFSEPLIVKSAFLPRGHVLCNAEDYEIVERLIDSYVTKQTVIELIDEAIARQSVKSEEVAEAIEWIEEILSNGNMWQDGDFGIPVKTSRKLEDIKQTILAALQAYKPTGE